MINNLKLLCYSVNNIINTCSNEFFLYNNFYKYINCDIFIQFIKKYIKNYVK